MKKTFIYKLLIVVLMAIIGAYFYNKLPNEIPIHWGFDGKPDNWGNKLNIIVGIPALTLFIALLFPVLAKIDPKNKNYKKFQKTWEIFQFAIIGFFAYFYFVSIYVILHPEANISTFIILGIGILFIIIGNFMGKIKQNFFVGMKFPWTLSDEEVWNKTHRFGGKIFMLGGLILAINAFLKWQIFAVFIFVVLLIVVVPIGYSYYLYQKKGK